MPIVTEHELEEFNQKSNTLSKILDEHEDLKEDHEELEQSYEKVIQVRNIFIGISILLGLLLIAALLLKLLKPSLFVNEKSLQKDGYTLVENEEYSKLVDYKNQVADLEDQGRLETTSENGTSNSNSQSSIGDTKVFAVQIGAFTQQDIGLYSDSFTQFNEFKEEGFYKYSLGAFETLEEAQSFRKKVISLGFKDAFVASYQNGERLNIEYPY